MADIIISKTIQNVNVEKASAGFLKEHPIPQIDDPDNPGILINAYTVKEWFTKVIFAYGDREIKHGLKRLADEDNEYTSVFE